MGMIIGGLASLLADIDNSVEKVEREFGKTVKRTVEAVHESLISKTPVYTGETVRNYIWTMGVPYNGPALAAIGTDDPGHTSEMALGVEPRRPANEAAATATIRLLAFSDPYTAYHVNNKSPAVAGLERGELPGNYKKSRSPQGMFLITEVLIGAKLKSGIIK